MSDKEERSKKKEVRSRKAGSGSVTPKQLEQLQQQVSELTADLQRARADFANFQRRTGEEQQQLMQIAKEQVVLQVLPLLDNVQRALEHVPVELADNAWAGGVKKVGGQAANTLKNLGVEPIPAVGEEFDPKLHEAVNFEDGEGDHEVVTEELQTGYRMGERVIRPSMVKVGRSNTLSKSHNQVKEQ